MVCVVATPTNVQKHCLQVKAGGIPALLPPCILFPQRVALFLAPSFASVNVSLAFSRIRTDASTMDDRFLVLIPLLFASLVLPSTLVDLRHSAPPKRTIACILTFNLCQFCFVTSSRKSWTCSNGACISAADPISYTKHQVYTMKESEHKTYIPCVDGNQIRISLLTFAALHINFKLAG